MANVTESFKFTPDSPGCHGNKIWAKMGYKSVSAKDICEIVASIRGFSGLGHRMLLMKFYLDRPLLSCSEI